MKESIYIPSEGNTIKLKYGLIQQITDINELKDNQRLLNRSFIIVSYLLERGSELSRCSDYLVGKGIKIKGKHKGKRVRKLNRTIDSFNKGYVYLSMRNIAIITGLSNGESNKMMTLLVANNIIECDNVRRMGEKPFGYRVIIIDKSKEGILESYEFTRQADITMKKGFRNKIEKYRKSNRIPQYMSHVYNTIMNLNIDIGRLKEDDIELYTKYRKTITEINSDYKINDRNKIHRKIRLQHKFNGIKKKLRNYIVDTTGNIKEFVAVDLTASHLLFLVHFIENDYKFDGHYNDDFQHFKELVFSGKLKKYISDNLDIPNVKLKLFSIILYSKNTKLYLFTKCKEHYVLSKEEHEDLDFLIWFRDTFPTVFSWLISFKRDHSDLSQKMQVREARFILDKICVNLKGKVDNIFPLHDCIVCDKSKVDDVVNVFNEQAMILFGQYVPLKVEKFAV